MTNHNQKQNNAPNTTKNKTVHQTWPKTKQHTNHNQKQNNAPNTTKNKTMHQTQPKTKQCTKHDLKQNTAPNMTYIQPNEPSSLVTEDALTQCYYLLHHILITRFSSSGMWQCVAWRAVPSVFKDHSSFIFGALQSFETSHYLHNFTGQTLQKTCIFINNDDDNNTVEHQMSQYKFI